MNSQTLFKKWLLLVTCIFCLTSVSALAKGPVKAKILKNKDFRYGSYIIDKPGVYRLAEDISFNPNSVDTLNKAVKKGVIPKPLAKKMGLFPSVDAFHAGFPLFTQFKSGGANNFKPAGPLVAQYDPAGFGLGFFAAIVIKADNVVLDLAGHTIEQSKEHALLQRFFAVIELAEQPFIPNQGPADFGDVIESAHNVVIKNGVIGRSSHHGIHGNGNKNIRILNVDFEDYEVAALALNGVEGLVVKNSNASNRKDVPVVGTFSSAQFIKPYIAELARNNSSTTLTVDGQSLSIADIQSALRAAVNNVYADVIENAPNNGSAYIDKVAHPAEYALFHNQHGIIDGNSYSFLVNPLGVAVLGFPTQATASNMAKNIFFSNVQIDSQRAFINEVVALNQGGPVIDPVGAVFQTLNVNPDNGQPVTVSSLDLNAARYTGNAVANAQAFVAKAKLAGEFDNSKLDLKRLGINQTVLNWVEAKPGFETLDSIAGGEGGFLCNGDSMFHVNKGVIGFKMDGAQNVVMRNTNVADIENIGKAGSDICGDYSNTKSHPAATLPGYGGAETRAYTFAGSKNVLLANSSAVAVKAAFGSAKGVDVMTDTSKAAVFNTQVIGVDAANQAIGFQIGEDVTKASVRRSCASLLNGMESSEIVLDESDMATIRKICQ